jgi:glutathionyl-hydroquinone reductase
MGLPSSKITLLLKYHMLNINLATKFYILGNHFTQSNDAKSYASISSDAVYQKHLYLQIKYFGFYFPSIWFGDMEGWEG